MGALCERDADNVTVSRINSINNRIVINKIRISKYYASPVLVVAVVAVAIALCLTLVFGEFKKPQLPEVSAMFKFKRSEANNNTNGAQ